MTRAARTARLAGAFLVPAIAVYATLRGATGGRAWEAWRAEVLEVLRRQGGVEVARRLEAGRAWAAWGRLEDLARLEEEVRDAADERDREGLAAVLAGGGARPRDRGLAAVVAAAAGRAGYTREEALRRRVDSLHAHLEQGRLARARAVAEGLRGEASSTAVQAALGAFDEAWSRHEAAGRRALERARAGLAEGAVAPALAALTAVATGHAGTAAAGEAEEALLEAATALEEWDARSRVSLARVLARPAEAQPWLRLERLEGFLEEHPGSTVEAQARREAAAAARAWAEEAAVEAEGLYGQGQRTLATDGLAEVAQRLAGHEAAGALLAAALEAHVGRFVEELEAAGSLGLAVSLADRHGKGEAWRSRRSALEARRRKELEEAERVLSAAITPLTRTRATVRVLRNLPAGVQREARAAALVESTRRGGDPEALAYLRTLRMDPDPVIESLALEAAR